MTETLSSTTMTTPAGPLTIVATDAGVVRAAGFHTDVATLVAGIGGLPDDPPRPRHDLGVISKAVAAYLAGDLDRLDEVPVVQRPDLAGSFLADAWTALRQIPAGEVITYTDLAARASRPAAVRAAANACARNQVALFVPCHRVRRGDGGAGGYRWGTEVKELLLAHERSASGR